MRRTPDSGSRPASQDARLTGRTRRFSRCPLASSVRIEQQREAGGRQEPANRRGAHEPHGEPGGAAEQGHVRPGHIAAGDRGGAEVAAAGQMHRHGDDDGHQQEHGKQCGRVRAGQRPGFLNPTEGAEPDQPVQVLVGVGRHGRANAMANTAPVAVAAALRRVLVS